MLTNTQVVEAVSTREWADFSGKFGEADGASGYLIEIIAKKIIFFGGSHWRVQRLLEFNFNI
jgi:hypothetical protein